MHCRNRLRMNAASRRANRCFSPWAICWVSGDLLIQRTATEISLPLWDRRLAESFFVTRVTWLVASFKAFFFIENLHTALVIKSLLGQKKLVFVYLQLSCCLGTTCLESVMMRCFGVVRFFGFSCSPPAQYSLQNAMSFPCVSCGCDSLLGKWN